jgi:hypothetical protein
MAKNKISEFDVNPDNNTDINNINIAEGCAPSGINNAIRQLMSDLKEQLTGASGDPFTVGGAFAANGGATLGDASGDALTINSSAVSIPNGLNFDSNTLVIDATNNFVGVGRASPASALDVNGVATFSAGSASAPAITTTGDTNTGIFFPAENTIAFTDGGVESMRISGAGNIGIGTVSPAAKLDVVGTLRLTNTANSSNYGLLSDLGGLYIQSLNSNPMYFATGGSERMRIDSSGNVGIGVGSPSDRLDVAGSNSRVRWGLSTTSVTQVASNVAGNAFANAVYDGALHAWSTSSTERMRIDSTGNLLVGATSGVGSVGRVQSIQTNPSAAGLSVDVTNASFDYKVIYLNTTRAASTGFDFIQATTSSYGTIQFRIRGDGNMYNANGVYSTTSDIKLKENIVDATPKLEKLNQVRVVNYNLKDAELKQIGFIAQELEQVFPSLVEDNIDKDVSGNDLGTVTKSVKLTVFIPILVKAIQEQQAIITDLKSRIEALENK